MATCETCRWFSGSYPPDTWGFGFCHIPLPPIFEDFARERPASVTMKTDSCALHQPKENTDASSD